MITLTSLTQTSIVSPSQWEAETKCGRKLKICYRFQSLTVTTGSSLISQGEILFDEVLRYEPLHGFITEMNMKRYLSRFLEFPTDVRTES